MNDPTLSIATFRNKTDNQPKSRVLTWPALKEALTRHQSREAKDGPLWSPTAYPADVTRANANVEVVTLYVGEVDDGTTPDDLRPRWQTPEGKPLAFALHSSHSSTPESPRWRFAVPLARPVPAEQWPAVHAKLTIALLGDHADPSCKDCSRMYYQPSCPPASLEHAFADLGEGEWLDPDVFPDPEPEDVETAERYHAFRRGEGAPPLVEGGGGRPGDDYSARASQEEILQILLRYGWQIARRRGDVIGLTRPGKDVRSGISATLGHVGANTFYCFTSASEAAPFTANKGYSPFRVYGLLEHGGDFRAAARQLGQEGYGDPPRSPVPTAKFEALGEPETNDPIPAYPPGGYNLTDFGNAERLVHRHGRDLRFNKAFGWLVWDGKVWRVDDSGEVYRRMKETVRFIYQEAADARDEKSRLEKKAADLTREMATLPMEGGDEQRKALHARVKSIEEQAAKVSQKAKELLAWAFKSEAAPRVEAAVGLAEKESGIYAPPSAFDVDPMLLNVQNGILDLRTAELLPHRREALCTKICAVAYNPDATAPLWKKSRRRWLPDEEVRSYLFRSSGYCLTGHTGEETAFFLFGHGRNGKSKLTGALEYVMGDYAGRAPIEIFMQSRGSDGNGPTPDKAELAGKRMVIASEIMQARRLNESFVKDATGGDLLTACRKYQHPFTFKPLFKLWLYGNHKPIITGTDEGIKARLPLIPFTVTIPPEERDTDLDAKLRAEGEGILAWMIRGCLEWQEKKLSPPKAVLEASKAYHEEQDLLGGFFKARLIFVSDEAGGDGIWTPTMLLREALEGWAKDEGVDLKSLPRPSDLAERLRRQGCSDNDGKVKKINIGGEWKPMRAWSNVRLRTDTDPIDDAAEASPDAPETDQTDREDGNSGNSGNSIFQELSKVKNPFPIENFPENAVTTVTTVTIAPACFSFLPGDSEVEKAAYVAAADGRMRAPDAAIYQDAVLAAYHLYLNLGEHWTRSDKGLAALTKIEQLAAWWHDQSQPGQEGDPQQ